MRIAFAFAILIGLQSPAIAAVPERDRARAAFEAGKAAYARQQYLEAAVHFDDADREAPEARVRFNAAVAWERSGDAPRAADRYASAAPELTGRERSAASARLEVLEKGLATIHIDGPAGLRVTLAHVKDAAVPVTVHVVPGTHDIMAVDGARERHRQLTVRAHEDATLAFEIERSEDVPRVDPRSAPESTTAIAPTQSANGPVTAHRSSTGVASAFRPAAPWVTLGGSVLATGAALSLGGIALSARDDYLGSGNRDPEARERAMALRTGANIAWGAALVLAGVTVWLFLRPVSPQRKSQTVSRP